MEGLFFYISLGSILAAALVFMIIELIRGLRG